MDAPLDTSIPGPGRAAAPGEPAIDLFGLTKDAFIEAARALLPGTGDAARIYRATFRTGRFLPPGTAMGSARAAAWESAFSARLPEVATVAEEAGEGGSTAKALLRYADGSAIECVRVPMDPSGRADGRATLCLSSQVGCARACAFCETGRAGLSRNLDAGEIVAQALAARILLDWDYRNLVFMGMGEPLDNLDAVLAAIEILRAPSGLGIGQERISLCTSGHAAGIRRLARDKAPRIKLSVSLNAARDETRSRLMPINRVWPLAELADAIGEYAALKDAPVMLNYCLIPGLNDSPDDLEAIARFRAGIPSARIRINLIPYNPGPAPLARAPEATEVEAFLARLRASGLTVRARATRGRAIMAACGQLAAARPQDQDQDQDQEDIGAE